MTLGDRTRAVSDARRPGRALDDLELACGALAVLAGVAASLPFLAAAGVALAAYQLGVRTVSPDAVYMEGFTDGAVAAERLGRADAHARVERVRAEPPADDAGPAERGARPRVGVAPGRDEPPLDIAAIAGVTVTPRRPRPPLDGGGPVIAGPALTPRRARTVAGGAAGVVPFTHRGSTRVETGASVRKGPVGPMIEGAQHG